jgi:uncharacterized protein
MRTRRPEIEARPVTIVEKPRRRLPPVRSWPWLALAALLVDGALLGAWWAPPAAPVPIKEPAVAEAAVTAPSPPGTELSAALAKAAGDTEDEAPCPHLSASPIEREICASLVLAGLDSELTRRLDELRAKGSPQRASHAAQRDWLEDRAAVCGDSSKHRLEGCLRDSYLARLAGLETAEAEPFCGVAAATLRRLNHAPQMSFAQILALSGGPFRGGTLEQADTEAWRRRLREDNFDPDYSATSLIDVRGTSPRLVTAKSTGGSEDCDQWSAYEVAANGGARPIDLPPGYEHGQLCGDDRGTVGRVGERGAFIRATVEHDSTRLRVHERHAGAWRKTCDLSVRLRKQYTLVCDEMEHCGGPFEDRAGVWAKAVDEASPYGAPSRIGDLRRLAFNPDSEGVRLFNSMLERYDPGMAAGTLWSPFGQQWDERAPVYALNQGGSTFWVVITSDVGGYRGYPTGDYLVDVFSRQPDALIPLAHHRIRPLALGVASVTANRP